MDSSVAPAAPWLTISAGGRGLRPPVPPPMEVTVFGTASGHRTHRSSFRVRATAGVVAAGMFLAVGCSSSDDGPGTAAGGVPVVEKGRLTTCTHLPYPPFQFEQGGKVVGFDVALIDLV